MSLPTNDHDPNPEHDLGTFGLPGGGTIRLVESPAVHRVHTIYDQAVRPDMDPACAANLGAALVEWAAGNGSTPPANVQILRWQLPDPDLLAVLVERAVFGEDPTVENLPRYEQAYREAHRITKALPEVLGLLEQIHATQVVDAEVVDDLPMFPLVEDIRHALAYLDRVTPLLASATAEQRWAFDRLHAAVDKARSAPLVEDRPRVPLAPPSTVRDLETVVGYVEALIAADACSLIVVPPAVERLRQSIDAATAARADFFAELNGRDGDPVEDEDGAPLPDSVQALIRSASMVIDWAAEGGIESHVLTGLAVSLSRVLSESRR